MSEMFSVSVTAVGKTAKLAVVSVHPDSGPPTSEATFALQLIFDPIMSSGYSAFKKYKHLEASPLAQVMDFDSYLDPNWVRANARAFIAKGKVTKGVLEVWPTHPAWIEHLRKGMSWETAAYSNGPGDDAAPLAPGDANEAVHSDDDDGFRLAKPRDEELVEEVLLPKFGASRYIADPAITDRGEMLAAARELVSQPVVILPKRGPAKIGVIARLYEESAVYLYNESEGGYSGQSIDYDEIASIGRARLKTAADASKAAAATTKSDGKRAKAAATKKAAKPVNKPARTTAKQAAKSPKKAAPRKSAKSGNKPAKPTAKRPTKLAKKPAPKKSVKTR